MNLRDALIEALARTPEETAEWWTNQYRKNYKLWWDLEEVLAGLERCGDADEDTVRKVLETQASLHRDQQDIAAIRDRLAN